MSSSSHALLRSLFGKHFSADSQHLLKAFSSLSSILSEPLHSEVLDLVLDLLPASTQSYYLGGLIEVRAAGFYARCIFDSLLY